MLWLIDKKTTILRREEQLTIVWNRGVYSATIHRDLKRTITLVYTHEVISTTLDLKNVHKKTIQSRFSSRYAGHFDFLGSRLTHP